MSITQTVLATLNDLRQRDPAALVQLIQQRVACNAVLAARPTTPVLHRNDGTYLFGLLGLLNAVLADLQIATGDPPEVIMARFQATDHTQLKDFVVGQATCGIMRGQYADRGGLAVVTPALGVGSRDHDALKLQYVKLRLEIVKRDLENCTSQEAEIGAILWDLASCLDPARLQADIEYWQNEENDVFEDTVPETETSTPE